MSIYVQLLDAALGQPIPSTDPPSRPEALAEILKSRRCLSARGASTAGSHWAPDAVANELSYDTALIHLARLLGVECDLEDFDSPGHGRAEIESTLGFLGIRLDDLDRQNQSGLYGHEDEASGS